MELRLFIIACIMYAFMWVTRWLRKTKRLINTTIFGMWHATFLFLILSCAAYLFLFVLKGGVQEPIKTVPFLIIEVIILMVAMFGYSYGRLVEAKNRKSLIKKNMDWCSTVYFAGFVASFVMFCFLQAFKIPSASMRNTLQEGDHLFVNKAAYGIRVPFTNKRIHKKKIRRGDIVVFRFPADNPSQINCGGTSQYGRDFVKRVIGLPGEIVEVRNGVTYINGNLLPREKYELYEDVERTNTVEIDDPNLYQGIWQSHRLDNYLNTELRDNFGPAKVPEGNYFVMGDNRDNSCDSRFWGPVPQDNIKGKAWFIHWPLKKIGFIK